MSQPFGATWQHGSRASEFQSFVKEIVVGWNTLSPHENVKMFLQKYMEKKQK